MVDWFVMKGFLKFHFIRSVWKEVQKGRRYLFCSGNVCVRNMTRLSTERFWLTMCVLERLFYFLKNTNLLLCSFCYLSPRVLWLAYFGAQWSLLYCLHVLFFHDDVHFVTIVPDLMTAIMVFLLLYNRMWAVDFISWNVLIDNVYWVFVVIVFFRFWQSSNHNARICFVLVNRFWKHASRYGRLRHNLTCMAICCVECHTHCDVYPAITKRESVSNLLMCYVTFYLPCNSPIYRILCPPFCWSFL